jgi:hypothetical protein
MEALLVTESDGPTMFARNRHDAGVEPSQARPSEDHATPQSAQRLTGSCDEDD